MATPVLPEHRSTEPTAYDHRRFGHILDWTKTAVLINGRPVTIVSAEFQYFRVPDRERWRSLLIDIKGMGFNTVRFYIHWGYHSAAEGVYNFRGNRDIEYLLELCTELSLFVIVAPGPYICAEVQAGGFPIWLIAKRHLRVRHMTLPPVGLVKKWDQRWHDYCAEYLARVVRMMVPYERTTNPNGCIIALQIENELREPTVIGFGGIDNEMRLLCDIARKEGSTVPIFHNDDSPVGSWSAGEHYRSAKRLGRRTGAKAYRTDYYGFDLYFTFPTGDRSGDLSSCQVGMIEMFGVSACLNCCGVGGPGVGGSDTPCLSCLYDSGCKHAPPPALGWSTANQMEPAVDRLEKKMEKFGGSARNAPVVCAEAQVGWINQWGRMRTYDDIYTFFGDRFSAALQFSLSAQGVTVVNHYIAYGGTNHGTVGDTEVYTSYDYSAFIREFGLLSGRGRVLRSAMLFARSFSDLGLSDSVMVMDGNSKKSRATMQIKSTTPDALIAVREARQTDSGPHDLSANRATYAFLRNLKEDNLRFNLIVRDAVLPCRLGKCESFVVPLYHKLEGSLSIFACTVPVISRATYDGSELWVLRLRKPEIGRLVLTTAGKHTSGRQGVSVQWANFNTSNGSGSMSSGEITVTDQDPGAASSLLSAPLEELALAGQDSLAEPGYPVGVKASTEEVGLCFSMSFSMEESYAVAITDKSEDGSLKPVLRLLCLNEKDSNTFTADIHGHDAFHPELYFKPFGAAWGASNLTFTSSTVLDVGFAPGDDKSTLFVLQDPSTGATPEQFEPGPQAASALMPGLFMHEVPENALSTAVSQGIDFGDPLSPKFEIPIENLSRRILDWSDDVTWKRISYEDRNPLDHMMTSGHVAYRLRFRSPSTRGSFVANVRHSAVIWCNGQAVGDQICFSHNLISAGAMHGVDVSYAGKKRHDISAGLQRGPNANGLHEVVILVLSMGQSRSPFLLNDVRNPRGLVSGRLSRSMKVSDVSWEISGVDVSRSDDAYGTSGLALEDEANTASCESGFESVERFGVVANDGVVYFRGNFHVPASSVLGGSVRYPLRLKVLSGTGVRAMLWVNTLFMGRYVEQLGPQSDFYIPEGLIKQCKGNVVVVAVYGAVDTNISVRLLPWVVDRNSGNLNEESGEVYALRCATFNLAGKKSANI